MIRIFDSLLHPTISGGWFGQGLDSSFESLRTDMKRHERRGGCAVGLWGVEGYSHKAFIDACRSNPSLVPVAGFSPKESRDIPREIEDVATMGFRALKIHPRLSQIDLHRDKSLLTHVFNIAHEQGLAIFLCTYFSCSIERFPTMDPFWSLVEILQHAPNTRVVLLHGGVINLLQYAELARFNPHLLLDLSYTMIKYQGSSIEQDVLYLFRTLDRKICVGSDHPECGLGETQHAFEKFSEGLSKEKKENIAYRNIMSLLKIQNDE